MKHRLCHEMKMLVSMLFIRYRRRKSMQHRPIPSPVKGQGMRSSVLDSRIQLSHHMNE